MLRHKLKHSAAETSLKHVILNSDDAKVFSSQLLEELFIKRLNKARIYYRALNALTFQFSRGIQGGKGRNWLFFGNPHFHSDFLYQTEWQRALQDGQLQHLDLAFSRDQENKIYVQHRLLEKAAEVYAWIQGGAHIYVCGDATQMAKDVHQTLQKIAQQEGGLDADQARSWLEELSAQGRYARDVY